MEVSLSRASQEAPRPGRVAILRLDPDLAAHVPHATAAAAQHAARARVAHVGPGLWRPPWRRVEPGSLGLLLLGGMLCRTVTAGQDSTTELLGAGDLLRTWDDARDSAALNGRVTWQVVDGAHLALLDRQFTQSIAPWPEIHDALMARALRRSHVQAHLNATSNVKRVDIRLLALLAYITERWGRMTPRGAVVTTHLTHTQLASLVGARRPSVTTSLKRLEARGLIAREDGGLFLLNPEAVSAELEVLCFSESARHLRLVHRT